MIIECSGCGKRYRIDTLPLKVKGIKFKCKICHKENKILRITNNELKHYSNIANAPPRSTEKINYNSTKTDKKLNFTNYLTTPESTETAIRFTPKKEEYLNKPSKSSTHQTKKKHRFGLTMKVTGIMLMTSIIPLLLLWISSYKRLENQITNDTEVLHLESATGLSQQINEWVDKNVRIIYALSKMPAIISMDPARQTPLLKIVEKSYPWMYLVFTVGPDGMNVARNDGKALKDYHDRIYVQGALKGKQLTWQTIVSRTNHKPAIVFSTPIRKNDKIVGVMAAGVNLDKISQQISSWRTGQSGNAFLLDENYKVVAHQIDDYVQKQEIFDNNPLIQKHENGNRGLIQFTSSKGTPSVGVVTKTNQGWFLAIQQRKSEAFKNITKAQQYAIILLSVTVLIVIFISWFSGQAITKPIKKIIVAADRISVGDFNVSLNTEMKNEIGDLTSAIIRMKECIRLSLKRLEKRRISRSSMRTRRISRSSMRTN